MPTNSLPQTLSARAIDQLIAEKVMGWEYRAHTGLWTHNATRQWSVDASHLPHYSTKITAAFQVAEKMHAQIYATNSADPFTKPSIWDRANYLTLSCLSGDNDYAATFCCLGVGSEEWHETPEKYGGARAATAPMAICLSALKALGVEVPV